MGSYLETKKKNLKRKTITLDKIELNRLLRKRINEEVNKVFVSAVFLSFKKELREIKNEVAGLETAYRELMKWMRGK